MGKDKYNSLQEELNQVQEELKKLLEAGTPRQKALFLCKNWYEPRSMEMYGAKPLIDTKQLNSVLDSIQGNKTREAFHKWMNYYYLYADIIQLSGLGMAEYQKAVHELVGYIRIWESYEWEATMINSAYDFAKEKGEEATDNFLKLAYESNNQRKYGDLKQGEDGRFYIDITNLYESYVKPSQERLVTAYSNLKAFIEVLEAYMEKTNSKEFLPNLIRKNISEAKQGREAFNLRPFHSYTEYRKRKERGEKEPPMFTDEIKELFPEYETLQVSPAVKAHFERVLKNRENLV